MPVVKDPLDYDTAESVYTAIYLALDGYNIYKNGKSMYYYFDFGKYIGLFLSQAFVAADAWAGSEIMVATNPWELYVLQDV